MRPASIRMFHRLMVVFAAISLIQIIGAGIQWQAIFEVEPDAGFWAPGWAIVGLPLAIYGAYAVIWFRIVAHASTVARWGYTVVVLLALVGTPITLSEPTVGVLGALAKLLILSTSLLQLAALVCLFLPDSRLWFANKKTAADPLVFE